MKKLLALGLLTTMALAIGDAPVRGVDQKEIDFAVERGAQALRRMQNADGSWQHTHMVGATALCGLTLLECVGEKDDKDVLRAAEYVRKFTPRLQHTYSISLAIVFLDLLGDAGDAPLIESLMLRLLAGQGGDGGWSYTCPALAEADIQRLQDQIRERKSGAGGGGRESAKPEEKRKPSEPPPPGREQRDQILRRQSGPGQPQPGGPGGFASLPAMPSDNSNTQFAALALWIGRRHGIAIERALTRLDRRFRSTQMKEGGWGYYVSMFGPAGLPENKPMAVMPPRMGSTAAMTCAGLLALAVADGYTLEKMRERKADAKVPNVDEDKNLKKGLEALGEVIDNPKSLKPAQGGAYHPLAPQQAARVGGRTYYFLWSLERVAMALDLKTIGKKDWFGWGAEILLENQERDGTWRGDYGEGGIDTCFALLFLKRANLVRDLTAQLKGKLKDPGERTLRGGIGLPGNTARGKKSVQSGIESLQAKPFEKPVAREANTESARLADTVVKASGSQQVELLEKMESEKGLKYTEALAAAIPKLEGGALRKARQVLADRLTRMKNETLAEYLQDEDAEIRRAAALAVGQKESTELLPNLISALRDPEINVVRAAHASLKELTKQDFGPAAKATREERDQAALKWLEWWSKQRKK